MSSSWRLTAEEQREYEAYEADLRETNYDTPEETIKMLLTEYHKWLVRVRES